MRKVLGIVFSLLLIPTLVCAQAGVKKRRPLPPQTGGSASERPMSTTKFPDAQFDHWLHRAKWTCRLCHVDIGFAMKTNGTNIKAEDNISGYYCGTCHNGKMDHEDRKVFAACAKTYTDEDRDLRCLRCHSGKDGSKRKYDFFAFAAGLPKERFGNGIGWEEAEVTGKINTRGFHRRGLLQAQGTRNPQGHRHRREGAGDERDHLFAQEALGLERVRELSPGNLRDRERGRPSTR